VAVTCPECGAPNEDGANYCSRCGALLEKGDVPGAFREYCRAMLPLTRALHERRQKEEVFSPVWDKSR